MISRIRITCGIVAIFFLMPSASVGEDLLDGAIEELAPAGAGRSADFIEPVVEPADSPAEPQSADLTEPAPDPAASDPSESLLEPAVEETMTSLPETETVLPPDETPPDEPEQFIAFEEAPAPDRGALLQAGLDRFGYVGKVRLNDTEYITGVVVGCAKTVVTAAGPLRRVARESVRFETAAGTVLRVADIHFRTDGAIDDPALDLAILELETSVPDAVIPARVGVAAGDVPHRATTMIIYSELPPLGEIDVLTQNIGYMLGTGGSYNAGYGYDGNDSHTRLIHVIPGESRIAYRPSDSGSPVAITFDDPLDDFVLGMAVRGSATPSMWYYLLLAEHREWLTNHISGLRGICPGLAEWKLFDGVALRRIEQSRENVRSPNGWFPANVPTPNWTTIWLQGTTTLAAHTLGRAAKTCRNFGKRLPTKSEIEMLQFGLQAEYTGGRWQRSSDYLWSADLRGRTSETFDLRNGTFRTTFPDEQIHYICVW